jgi:hypothetical protein
MVTPFTVKWARFAENARRTFRLVDKVVKQSEPAIRRRPQRASFPGRRSGWFDEVAWEKVDAKQIDHSQATLE